MSNYLNEIKFGDYINVRGPFGKFKYLGDGNSQILLKYKPLTYHEHKYKKIGLLGAGTGITPLYQLLQAANLNKDTCEFVLFFGNTTPKDILLHKELLEIEEKQNFKFKLVLMVSKPDEDWKGETGHFNKENIEKYMPGPSDDTLILHCGPKSLCKDIYQRFCEELGHKQINIFEF